MSMKKEDDIERVLTELHESVSNTSRILFLLIAALFCAFLIMLLDLGEDLARRSFTWLLGAAELGVLPCLVGTVKSMMRIGKVRRSIARTAPCEDGEMPDPADGIQMEDDLAPGQEEYDFYL